LDGTLKLTCDELYELDMRMIYYKAYASYFKEKVKRDENVRMHLERITVDQNSVLKEMYVNDYTLSQNQKMREE
ncbi:FAD-binding protein, partial [Bacillus thuringiensis]|nr:FAD-binding protein [Bacillus thuringiensis]